MSGVCRELHALDWEIAEAVRGQLRVVFEPYVALCRTVAEHLYLVVEAVPAKVCKQCAAAYTDRQTTEALMRLVQRIRDSVPVGGRATLIHDFSAVEQLAKTA